MSRTSHFDLCDKCKHHDECGHQPDGAHVVSCPRFEKEPKHERDRNGDA